MSALKLVSLAGVACLLAAAVAMADEPAGDEGGGGLARLKAATFERKNSDEDLLRGSITHSWKRGGVWVAYLVIRWGDLDRKIDGYSPDYYSNWDGHVALDKGIAMVARKLAFDDGTARRIDDRRAERAGAEPGPGSGRDRIVPETDPKKIVWKAGVVGGTDGLVIRIEMPEPTGVCRVKAGNFSLELPVRPVPRRGK